MAETLIILFGINVTWWKILGWTGVFMFTGRWLVQMHFSRKAGKPVLPRLYWFMSMAGSLILLSYFCLSPQRGTVGFLSNFFPLFVAGYNLVLDRKDAAKRATAPVLDVKDTADQLHQLTEEIHQLRAENETLRADAGPS